jgi:tetrahydromethanopterin S-methyltransferase subunit G
MIEKRLVDIEDKIDTIIGSLHKMELKLTKRVDRNTLILNIIIRVSLVLFIAVVGAVFAIL